MCIYINICDLVTFFSIKWILQTEGKDNTNRQTENKSITITTTPIHLLPTRHLSAWTKTKHYIVKTDKIRYSASKHLHHLSHLCYSFSFITPSHHSLTISNVSPNTSHHPFDSPFCYLSCLTHSPPFQFPHPFQHHALLLPMLANSMADFITLPFSIKGKVRTKSPSLLHFSIMPFCYQDIPSHLPESP